MVKYNNRVFKDVNEEQLDFLIKSWETLSNAEIAEKLGIHSKRVSQIAKAIGLPHKKLVYTPKNGLRVNGRFFTNLSQEMYDYIINNADKKCVDIAKEVGIDSRKVSAILLASGIRERKYNTIEETEEFMTDIKDTSKTNVELAKKYNVSASAIGARRRALGIMFSPLKLPRTSEVEEDLKNPYKSHVELARKYGVSEATIARRRNELGVKVRLKNFNTIPEIIVAEVLEELDYAYIQQKHIGKWSIDFYLGNKTCIDVHGEWTHSKPKVVERDKRKAEFLKSEGYRYLIIYEKDTRLKDTLKDIISKFMSGSTTQ